MNRTERQSLFFPEPAFDASGAGRLPLTPATEAFAWKAVRGFGVPEDLAGNAVAAFLDEISLPWSVAVSLGSDTVARIGGTGSFNTAYYCVRQGCLYVAEADEGFDAQWRAAVRGQDVAALEGLVRRLAEAVWGPGVQRPAKNPHWPLNPYSSVFRNMIQTGAAADMLRAIARVKAEHPHRAGTFSEPSVRWQEGLKKGRNFMRVREGQRVLAVVRAALAPGVVTALWSARCYDGHAARWCMDGPVPERRLAALREQPLLLPYVLEKHGFSRFTPAASKGCGYPPPVEAIMTRIDGGLPWAHALADAAAADKNGIPGTSNDGHRRAVAFVAGRAASSCVRWLVPSANALAVVAWAQCLPPRERPTQASHWERLARVVQFMRMGDPTTTSGDSFSLSDFLAGASVRDSASDKWLGLMSTLNYVWTFVPRAVKGWGPWRHQRGDVKLDAPWREHTLLDWARLERAIRAGVDQTHVQLSWRMAESVFRRRAPEAHARLACEPFLDPAPWHHREWCVVPLLTAEAVAAEHRALNNPLTASFMPSLLNQARLFSMRNAQGQPLSTFEVLPLERHALCYTHEGPWGVTVTPEEVRVLQVFLRQHRTPKALGPCDPRTFPFSPVSCRSTGRAYRATEPPEYDSARADRWVLDLLRRHVPRVLHPGSPVWRLEAPADG